MKDDLISREAVLEYLDKRRTYELIDGRNKAYGKGIRDAIKDIEAQPSVPAVPLDKLSAILGKNADCPPGHSPVQYQCKESCAECWKSVLKEWMEEWTCLTLKT